MRALLLALLPALALAAPPPARRVSSLLVPMDPASEAGGVQMESYMNEALDHFSGFAVRKPEELFGLPADTVAQAALDRARKVYSESVAAFDKKEYDEAEKKVRLAMKELEAAAGAMRSCSPLCDSLALYAAVLQLRGDVEEAKLALIDLIALAPTFELDPKRYSREFIALRVQVATGRTAQLRGSAVVKTRPAGARVYLDGELVGYSPVTLPAVAIGKHLVRLERPGFRQHGLLLEVTPDDVESTTDLVPTSAYKTYDAQLDKVAGEVLRAAAQSNGVAAMGQTLGLDRVMVGTLKASGDGGTELSLGYYETRNGKRLAGRRVVLQGDEFGQLKQEMERMVNQLVNTTGEKVKLGRDPLDNKGGTEDWSSEDRGGKSRAEEKKKKADDPLDGVSGTEDW